MTEADNSRVIAELERHYRRATAIFYGSIAVIPLGLLGYKHFVSEQTVAVFTAGFEGFPDFAVVPQTWADKVEQVLLGTSPGKSFQVPGEGDFNRHFAVVGADRPAVLGCLSAEVI